jgi:hypothetical protein
VSLFCLRCQTQYPDVNHGVVENFPFPSLRTPIRAAVNNNTWLDGEFLSTVQDRGAAIIKAREKSSAASAASSCVDHVRDWVLGTKKGEFVSMAVYSDGVTYGIPGQFGDTDDIERRRRSARGTADEGAAAEPRSALTDMSSWTMEERETDGMNVCVTCGCSLLYGRRGSDLLLPLPVLQRTGTPTLTDPRAHPQPPHGTPFDLC